MYDFDYLKWRKRKSQSFDKANITLKKAGKEINVYDAIQANREDTEIYPTLEKYGCIDRMMLNSEGVYADFTIFKGLREIKEQQEMANNMFYNLPLEIRQVFNNDKNIFMRDGEKWLKNKINEEKVAKEKELAEIYGNNQTTVSNPTVEPTTTKEA